MLPKQNRLDKLEIDSLKKHSKNVHSKNFTLLFDESKTSNTPLFAIIISKKVSKKAVDRNRIKRIIREAIRKNINNLKSINYLIIAKQSALSLNNNDIRKEISDLLN